MAYRTYYATEAVQVAQGSKTTPSSYVTIPGVSSVGLTVNYNSEPVFQLGQEAEYELFSDTIEAEVTISKTLDDRVTLYGTAMGEGSIQENDEKKTAVKIFHHGQVTTITDAYLESVSYNFNTEGFSTEEVTIVGSEVAVTAGTRPDPGVLPANKAVVDRTKITTLGLVDGTVAQTTRSATVSMSFNRESLFKFGKKLPYHRYIPYPIEVNVEFEQLITDTGGQVDAAGGEPSNPCDASSYTTKTFYAETCDGMRIEITGVRVVSQSYGGGDTGGENAVLTTSYQAYSSWDYTSPTA